MIGRVCTSANVAIGDSGVDPTVTSSRTGDQIIQWDTRLFSESKVLGEVENCKIEETGDFCAGANLTRSDPSATRHRCQALKQSQKLKTRSSVYWLRRGKLQIVPGCTPRIFGDPGRKKE